MPCEYQGILVFLPSEARPEHIAGTGSRVNDYYVVIFSVNLRCLLNGLDDIGLTRTSDWYGVEPRIVAALGGDPSFVNFTLSQQNPHKFKVMRLPHPIAAP